MLSRYAVSLILKFAVTLLATIGLIVVVSLAQKPELRVEIAGCDMVRAPPPGPHGPLACKLGTANFLEGAVHGVHGSRRVRLSITTSPGARVRILLNGTEALGARLRPVPSRGMVDVYEGDVDVHEGARLLSVTAGSFLFPSLSEKHRPLFSQDPTPEQSDFDRAVTLMEEGDRAGAKPLFERLTRGADPVLRARATGRLARLAYYEDVSEAVQLAYAAQALDLKAGLLSDQIADGFFLVTVLIDAKHDIEAARALFDDLAPVLANVPAGRAIEPNYRAYLNWAQGDLDGALVQLAISEAASRRLDLTANLVDVLQKKAEVLELIGRHDEVAPVLAELRTPAIGPRLPCAQARLANNLGWIAILSGRPGPEARSDLERALTIFSTKCDRAPDRANTLTNLAHLELALGRGAEAMGHLARIPERPAPAPRFAADRLMVAGSAALLRRAPWEALDHFHAAGELARKLGLPLAIAAGFGAAEALEAFGETDAALAEYARADVALDHFSAHISLGAGQSLFVDRYERGLERYVHLLVQRAEDDAGFDDEPTRRAACVARRSRARVRILAEFQRRRLRSGDALTRALLRAGGAPDAVEEAVDAVAGSKALPACGMPAEDEVLLVYHPLPDGTWAGFAITRDRAIAKRIPLAIDVADADLGAALFEPFDDFLHEPVRRVRLLAAGPLAARALHHLPFRGRDISDQLLVTYGVDVIDPPPLETGSKTALLVVVPRSVLQPRYLHAAKREADAVEEALQAAGWRVIRLEGEKATRAEVLRILAEEDLGIFHYVGHGSRAGLHGADSYVGLADGTLSLPDVLALPHAPQRVLLANCQGDAAGGGVVVADFGLAPAFIVAGARIAVALVGDPDDAHMARLMTKLYGPAHLPLLLADPPAALRAATIALRGELGMGKVVFPPLRILVR